MSRESTKVDKADLNQFSDCNTARNVGTGGSTTAGEVVQSDVPCDSSVYVGAIVRMNGSTAVNAQADSFTNSKAIGVCIAKSSSTLCDIQFIGLSSSVFSGLSIGDSVYLSDTVAGAVTTTLPTTSGSYVIKIGPAYTVDRLSINIERIVKRI